MDLFMGRYPPEPIELLPAEGNALYYGRVIQSATADAYYHRLLSEIVWKNDEAIIFGKKIITKRKVAWYAEKQVTYTYSNSTRTALPWTPLLDELRSIVENESGESYNSCLLNLYHDGDEGVGWHSDGEKELKENGAIGSLSFGAERKFAFKHKQTKQSVSVQLEHGSLLVMKGESQKHWLHSLPRTKKVDSPRINLTFRTIMGF